MQYICLFLCKLSLDHPIFDFLPMDLREQQKNLHAYLNNMPYEQRHPVFDHMIQFVKENEGFWIRSSLERNNSDQFFSFVQAVGFINIGKNMIEIRVMIPHNYPLAAPQFDLVFHSDTYDIMNHATLMSLRIISVRKNMANQELIRLSYESVKVLWTNINARHVCIAFKQIQRQVNNPPLLRPKSRQNNQMMITSLKNIEMNRNKSRGMTENIFCELQNEIISLQDKQSTVEIAKRDSDYKEARVDFFSRNTPKLGKVMKNQEVKINKELEILRKKHEDIITKDSFDPILYIHPSDEAKLQVMARHDTLKEAERKLVSSLQKNLGQLKVSFQDHKGLIRQFYEQMFDSQQQYLKTCQ